MESKGERGWMRKEKMIKGQARGRKRSMLFYYKS